MKLSQVSKTMSYILRHGARQEGIDITPEGWVEIEDLLSYLHVSYETVAKVVETNKKKRFEIDGEWIRATQGHSLGVSQEALEASWERFSGTLPVYHGTYGQALMGIAREGILPQKRTHVHMSTHPWSLVGKRANAEVYLHVSTVKLRELGIEVYRSSNDVILARYVPTQCIEKVSILFQAPIEVRDVQDLFPNTYVTLTV